MKSNKNQNINSNNNGKGNEMLDSFGFIIDNKQENNNKDVSPISKSKFKNEDKKLNARIEKWRVMLQDLEYYKQTNEKKFKERVKKGVPDCLRIKIWPKLAEIEKFKISENLNFNELLKKASPFEKPIDLDLNRTFPNHVVFGNDKNIGQTSLKNILKALSIVFPEVGYCQGLNFIAGVFLMYLNDEDAFWIMYSLFVKYDRKTIFATIKDVERHIFIYEKLLIKLLPQHLERLKKCSLDPILFSNSWFITMFINVLPFQSVLRILDIYLVEGDIIMYRIALAIIKILEKTILTSESLVVIMNSFSNLHTAEFQDADYLIRIAYSFNIDEKKIKKWDNEFRVNNPKIQQIEMENRKKAKSLFENADFKDDMDEIKNFNIEALNKSILDGTLRKSLGSMKKANRAINEEITCVDYMHPQN